MSAEAELAMKHDIIPGRLSPVATLGIAWRNLRRNRRRTWITASTVAVAVMLLQAVQALMIGLERQSFDNLINYQTANAKVYPQGYFEMRDEMPLEYVLSNLDDLEDRVREVSGVTATTPRLVFAAQISDGADQVSSQGVGIAVEGSDSDVFKISEAVIRGAYLSPGDEGMLLGSGLAELFDVSIDDWLTVLARTQAGAYEAMDLPVRGLLGTGNPLIDQNSFLLPLEVARSLLDMEQGATELAVRFSATADERTTLERLAGSLAGTGGVEVRGWREMEADFMSLVQMKRTGQAIMLALFVVMAVVGITNTILMAAFERTREIGMLMAMGLRGAGIRRMFLAEGAMTGLLGGALGSLVAFALIAVLSRHGIDLTAMYGDMDIGYPVRGVVYPAMNVFVFVLCWLGTGVLAALASLYPAARAAGQDPAEALRHA